MSRLILVKHSQPEIDPNKPAREWPLSEPGRARCVPLAAQLSLLEPNRIFSSDEPKAVETASLLAACLGLTTRVEQDLHEHGRAGVPWMDDAEWQQTMSAFFHQRKELVFGDESADQALGRFSVAVDRIVPLDSGDCSVIVAHGTVISLFAAAKTGADAHQLWCDLHLPSFIVLSMPCWAIEEVVNIG